MAATIAATAAAWVSVHAQTSAATAQSAVDFARDIQPILQAQLLRMPWAEEDQGALRLDSRAGSLKGGESGAAIVAGNSEHSLIVRRVLGLDGDDRMPKDGDPLPPAQIALIRAWIDQGARMAGDRRAAARRTGRSRNADVNTGPTSSP